MIKCCNCIKLSSLTLRVISLIIGPFISLSSHSKRTRTVFHWWWQPARRTLTRKNNKPFTFSYTTTQLLIWSLVYLKCSLNPRSYFFTIVTEKCIESTWDHYYLILPGYCIFDNDICYNWIQWKDMLFTTKNICTQILIDYMEEQKRRSDPWSWTLRRNNKGLYK